jgi:hypothetical protein
LHREELHDLYASQNIMRVLKKPRRMRWVGHVACMEEMRNKYKILVGKPELKTPFRIPGHRWQVLRK